MAIVLEPQVTNSHTTLWSSASTIAATGSLPFRQSSDIRRQRLPKCERLGRSFAADDADIGKSSVAVRKIKAVPDDELIADLKAGVVGLDGNLTLFGLVEQ